MNQKYHLTAEHSISSDENGEFSASSLALALAVVAGWQIGEKTALDDLLVSRALPGGNIETRFLPTALDKDTVARHANTYGIQPLMPLQSPEFAQLMMTIFPCVITPIISHGGSLRGLWRVESLSGWNAANLMQSGIRYGQDEYVETLSESLPEAIGLNALSRVGIGKQAYFYYPDMRTEDGELVFMGQATINTIQMDSHFMLHLVKAPELDAYAMMQAPEEVIEEARALADAQAVIQKAELAKQEEARKAEEDAGPTPLPPEEVTEPENPAD